LDTTKLKTHYWYWATQQLTPEEFRKQLTQATEYWTKQINLSKEQSQVVNSFFDQLMGDSPQSYSDGLATALCESLHNVNNKYCSKGEKYSNSVYKTRKNLALLDWNFRKEKVQPLKWKKELISSNIQTFYKSKQHENEILPMDTESS
jgi:hypothetical protein